MQIRAITIKGRKPTKAQMQTLVKRLENAIARAGFETCVFQVNGSRVDIKGGASGVSNKYATINVQKRGYNYRVNGFTAYHTKLGYKRTNVLSWNQRVELNNLINDVLDNMHVTATIASRGFVVRRKEASGGVGTLYLPKGRVNHWDVPFESNLGDSLQPNYHDWIYENEADAAEAVALAYPNRQAA